MAYPLFNVIFKSLTKKSFQSYTSYLTTLTNDIISSGVNLTQLQKDFVNTIPFALLGNAVNDVNNIINVISWNTGSLNPKKIAAFNSYKTGIGAVTPGNSLLSFFQNTSLTVYSQQDLKTKFQSRINSWSRLSGNKPWFPLVFIQKYCNQYGGSVKAHINYKNTVYQSLMLIIQDATSRYYHIPVSSVDYLAITDAGYVYCIYQKQIYQVFTPSGYLNHKVEMIVNDIQDIDIDHVTPIDTSLRKLKLPNLSLISNLVKAAKHDNPNLKGKNLETRAFEDYQNGRLKFSRRLNPASLDKELKRLANDSYYRLMDSKINRQKSNTIVYTEYYQAGSDFYGFIDDNVIDQHGNKLYLYQDLSQCKITASASLPSWTKIDAINIPINYL